MNDNQRVVKITHSDYEHLEVRLLADFSINVKAQRVYEMVLSNVPEKIYIPINIVTEPTEARIYIDGKDKGISETQKVFIGKHTIRIHKKGYKPIVAEIEVTENKTLFKYFLTEIEDVPIMIYSEPEGATVYIDNIKIGETPLASFYPDGKYTIKIEKRLYETIDEQIIIKLPKIEKRYILEPIYATLNIKTYPNATVYLNDEKLDSLHNIHLEPMLINLKVTMPKAEPLEKRIILKKNEIRTLDLFPDVKTGTIQIGIIPENAKIELFGDGGEYYTANEISNFKDIPVGEYELKVSKEGYGIYKEVIILKEGKKIKKQIKLEVRTTSPCMVFVQGGTFQMGQSDPNLLGEGLSNNEQPVHSVYVNDFYISKFEVTQKEWQELMGNNPSIWKGNDLPVNRITWYEAITFCNKKSKKEGLKSYYRIKKNKKDPNNINESDYKKWSVSANLSANGYRLPTEAEWEYAAKGGNLSKGYKYSGSNNVDEVSWFQDNSGNRPQKVGLKKPNELGIYDMSGNVFELCWDWYHEYYYEISPINNPKGPSRGQERVYRGDSYTDYFMPSIPSNSTSRGYNPPYRETGGIRLCMSAGFNVDEDVEVKNHILNYLNKYLIYIVLFIVTVISFSVVLLILRKKISRNKKV